MCDPLLSEKDNFFEITVFCIWYISGVLGTKSFHQSKIVLFYLDKTFGEIITDLIYYVFPLVIFFISIDFKDLGGSYNIAPQCYCYSLHHYQPSPGIFSLIINIHIYIQSLKTLSLYKLESMLEMMRSKQQRRFPMIS